MIVGDSPGEDIRNGAGGDGSGYRGARAAGELKLVARGGSNSGTLNIHTGSG